MKPSQLSGSIALAILLAARPGLGEPDEAGRAPGDPRAVQVLPCRPTIACTAEIVAAGVLEIETGYAQRRTSDAPVHSVVALAKYSATDRLQLQLGTNNLVTAQRGAGTQSFDGVYLGPKVVVVEQTERLPAISVSALVMVPTRSGAGAVTRTTDGYLWGYASRDVLGVHADLNLGINVLSLADRPAVQPVAALSLSHDLAHGLGAMLEGYTFEGGGAYAAHDAGVLMALSYSPIPRIMFDAGADIALHRDARDVTVFGGVTFIPYHAAPPRARTLTAARP